MNAADRVVVGVAIGQIQVELADEGQVLQQRDSQFEEGLLRIGLPFRRPAQTRGQDRTGEARGVRRISVAVLAVAEPRGEPQVAGRQGQHPTLDVGLGVGLPQRRGLVHLAQEIGQARFRGRCQGQGVQAALAKALAAIDRVDQRQERSPVDIAAQQGVLLGAAIGGEHVPGPIDRVEPALQAA